MIIISMERFVKDTLIHKIEKFVDYIKLLLVFSVSIVLLFAVGLLFYDIVSMVSNKYSEGIGTVLGSLLIIWVLLELLEMQFENLKGAKIETSVFVMVALVAFIRKLLVASLKSNKIELAYFLGAIVILSIVYFAIKRAENLRIEPKN